jgi:hypothetical protein
MSLLDPDKLLVSESHFEIFFNFSTFLAPVQPLSTRPRRSTKDAFYDKLSTLTSTKKSPIEEEFIEEKPKIKKKEEHRKSSSSSVEVPPKRSGPPKRPVLVKPKSEVLKIPISSSAVSQKSNGLHHFISECRGPHLTLSRLNIQSLSIDPRMLFPCSLCSRRFCTSKELDEHLAIHIENISSCSLCEKTPEPFTMEEYTAHLSSHFLVEGGQITCIFCGEVSGLKPHAELAQHLLYYCPSVRNCFICESELEVNGAHQHRRKHHAKLLNRYVCSTCFLGFPSLSPFLSHICDMRYRCLCEMTDVYMDHHSINQHIDECEEFERQYHGVLVPDVSGRKRCFFVNPHSVMPSIQTTPSSYGFRSKGIENGKNNPRKNAETPKQARTIPSRFGVPGTASRIRYALRAEMGNYIQVATADGRTGFRAAAYDEKGIARPPKLEPSIIRKPIYRPLSVPRLMDQEHIPRVIYPRNPRMVARLLEPATSSTPANAEGLMSENLHDFIPVSKRISEEENETVPPKRIRPSDDNEESNM